MDVAGMMQAVNQGLQAKWASFAYREDFVAGQIFYFVFTSTLNDRVVLFGFGTDVDDARRRLESSMRLLGVGMLMELEAGATLGRLSAPVCACGAVLEPYGERLWGLVAAWRCGVHACWRRHYTFGWRRAAPAPVRFVGKNDPFDIDC